MLREKWKPSGSRSQTDEQPNDKMGRLRQDKILVGFFRTLMFRKRPYRNIRRQNLFAK